MSYLRDLVEEPQFSQDVDSFREKYAHIAEVLEWISNTLSDNPRIGKAFKEAPYIRVLTTPILQDTPSFWVAYTLDENKIYLQSIEPVTE